MGQILSVLTAVVVKIDSICKMYGKVNSWKVNKSSWYNSFNFEHRKTCFSLVIFTKCIGLMGIMIEVIFLCRQKISGSVRKIDLNPMP
jgi:hypothetical protein